MAIKMNCPRCKTHLQVPNKLAGGYVNCPQCKGQLWVAKNAPADATLAENVGISDSGVFPIPAVPPNVATSTPPATSAPSAPPQRIKSPPDQPTPPSSAMGLPSPAPPPAPAPRKRVARFVAAEAADSTLRLAADGKLPELHLDEGQIKEKAATKSSSVNPLVMLGALSMSVVLSVVLVAIDMETPAAADSHGKAHMRKVIENDYFGAGDFESKDLEPYQVLLREAQRAYTRGDYKNERKHYRKVLDMLRAERGPLEKGLTGSRSRDKKLEKAISVLLSG